MNYEINNQEEVIIGARGLGDQITKIMPTYKVLLNQIEDLRIVAGEISLKKYDNINKKQDYNNTIGIFGARGSGKSSALYTLRTDLEKNKNNILLQLIEPDNFGGNTKILGSIVGLLKKQGKMLIKELKDNSEFSKNKKLSSYYNHEIYIPNNRLKQLINEVIELHLYTESHYRHVLEQNYEDLATHINKSSRLLIPDISFKEKFNELVNEMILVQHGINEVKSKMEAEKNIVQKQEVLIFIFVDDIDLKTSKTKELVDSLLQYTNHPNIVTILSGEYETLKESLTLALLDEEPLQNSGLNAYDSIKSSQKSIYKRTVENTCAKDSKDFPTILSRKSNLAHEYLKKIIPVSRRHQLVKWNEKTIPFFAFGKTTLMDQLVKLMGDNSVFSYKINKNESKESVSNILPITRSYNIFDERPRGIVHVYYHLNQLLNAVDRSNKEELFSYVKLLIDTIITSNNKLLDVQDIIFNQLIVWGDDASSSAINYSAQEVKNHNIELEILILGTMITYLLNQVNYDEDSYISLKNDVIRRLLLSKSDQLSEDEKIKSYFVNNIYKRPVLYHLMYGIASNAELGASLQLVEKLNASEFDSYYYDESSITSNTSDMISKNRFSVISVNSFIEQYPELFKTIFNRLYKDHNFEMQYIINILYDLVSLKPENEKTSQIFSALLLELNNYVKNTNRYENVKYTTSHEEEIQLASHYKRVLEFLIINSLTIIRIGGNNLNNNSDYNTTNDLITTMTVVVNDKNKELTHTLINVNEFIHKEGAESLPLNIQSAIDRKINKFNKSFTRKIIELSNEVTIKIDNEFLAIEEKFKKGKSGSERTRYSKCIDRYDNLMNQDRNNINKLEFSTFIKIIIELERLANNNYVWYGKTEARKLLTVIKQNSSISSFKDSYLDNNKESIFKGNDKLIIELYAAYMISSNKIVNFEDYEKEKKDVRDAMERAFNSVRLETEKELDKFGLSLEETEQ